MRILLDQGIFDMRNTGQNALLEGAVLRITKLWPDASIGITTFAPNLMKLYFPFAEPISSTGLHSWYSDPGRLFTLQQNIPNSLMLSILGTREKLWHSGPIAKLYSILKEFKQRIRSSNSINNEISQREGVESVPFSNVNLFDTVNGFDLLIATGSQYLTDHARDSGLMVLNRLETAMDLNIPTAMVGQGIGPISDPELSAKAKAVLPKVDLIFVREKLEAPNLLKSFGVDPSKIYVTGDDAIELVYRSRRSKIGTGIGVSVRVMPSTLVNLEETQMLGSVIKETAQKYKAQLIGLPISRSIHERDDKVIKNL